MIAAVAAVLASAMVFGEAAVRPEQTALAVQWQYYISNTGEYCEGCCSSGSLCCDIGAACRYQVQ